jgi:membrane protease YdiL (CAAX protease family)
MRPLRALVIYILVVFIGGALLAPWLYWLTQHFGQNVSKLADAPFHRFVNRAVLGIALIGLWPLVKNLGLTSPRDLGLVKPTGQWKNLSKGFLLGFISLAIVAALALALDARHLSDKYSGGQLAGKLAGAAVGAILVAVLEEILFRGALFGTLRKAFHWITALLISSAIYAIVHFLESAQDPETVTWLSGLQLLPLMFANFANWQAVFPGFFNLTLAGILLGLAYQRTGNLYFSIGLHTGWIFWIKSYGMITRATPGANTWWWGAGKLAVVNGWVALPVLVGTLLLFDRVVCRKTSDIQPSTSNIQ